MRATFPWFYKKTEQELKEIFDKAVFVFDTNILLNLYRYSNETKNDFLNVIRGLSERCFMPNRVALEFFNGRLGVINSQLDLYEKAVGKIRELKRDIDHSKQHPFVGEDLHKRSNELFEELSEELKAGKAKHASRINVDDILDDVSDIFDGKVGPSKSEDELKKITTEAENRFKNKTPPGFEDGSKAKDCTALRDKLRAYGDYIIWDEIMDYAKSEDVDIIFVTDDVKIDWWHKNNKDLIGPRTELLEEFLIQTGKKFHMYTSDQFFDFATDYLKLNVSDKSIHEVQELTYTDSLLKDTISGEGSTPEISHHLSDFEDFVNSGDANALNSFLINKDFESIWAWVMEEERRQIPRLGDISDKRLSLLDTIAGLCSRLNGFSTEGRTSMKFLILQYKLFKAINEYKRHQF
ncbi:PIN-like domain-containing protein [Shewanella algae]|uniref:PIN-like domain-containing protein n=1 Tax=Shewanella algae TaxID=38313 RepID=UPI000468A4FF|nr:PIN domain-containing protein [Shewanella algae]NKZ40878.1 DUF4935 domain-containing protein [Shewanella algae]QTE79845.1 DUF4935 domain-containing protein [Shewanella algae]